jgi:hypothetical protein
MISGTIVTEFPFPEFTGMLNNVSLPVIYVQNWYSSYGVSRACGDISFSKNV